MDDAHKDQYITVEKKKYRELVQERDRWKSEALYFKEELQPPKFLQAVILSIQYNEGRVPAEASSELAKELHHAWISTPVGSDVFKTMANVALRYMAFRDMNEGG